MARLGEPARPILGYMEVIFQAHTEFSVDADHRLVGEAHTGFQRHLVAFDQIGPLVHVEPDAVARAMGQVSRAERNQTKGRSKTLPPRPSG